MIPRTLGHYEIVRSIGSGGMGEVYLAEDTKLGRKVALKVLAAALASDPERRGRFEREARAIAALNHPNIVTIHSVEEQGGIVFLTMELVDGKTLSHLIAREGMTLDQLLTIAIPLADAVGAAHQRGITHRDLKPANVMVTGDGRVKVLDFGLAKMADGSPLDGYTATVATAQLTGEGKIMGTVAYMSPEQAEGKPVDPRSDIFSLGILLFEMATGQKPFRGDSHVSLLSAILKDTPQSVTDLRQDLPREFARMVRRCLAKDPEERYQTAKDLRNDLRSLKEDLDTGEISRDVSRSASRASVAGPAPPDAVARVPARRLTPPLIAGIVLFAILAAAVVIWFALRTRPAATPLFTHVRLSRLTNTGDASLAAISADGRYVVHVVGDVDRPSLWMRQVSTTSNVQIVPPQDGRYDGLSFSPDGEGVLYVFYPKDSNFASLFQVALLGGTPRKIVDDIDTPPTFSPDGTRMAFVRGLFQQGQAIIVANRDGTGERQLALRKPGATFQQTGLAWSPDGRSIAAPVGSSGPRGSVRVVLVDAERGTEQPLGTESFNTIGQLAWTADGSALLLDAVELSQGPDAGGQIWALSYPAGSVRRVTSDLNNYSGISASRRSHQLAAVQRESRASLWMLSSSEPSSGRPIISTSNGQEGAGGIDWTPGGQIVYAAATRGSWDIWIANRDGTEARQITSDPTTEGLVQVSPDGTRIVYVSDRTGRFEIWTSLLDGSNARQLSKSLAFNPQFLGDSRTVVFYAVDGARPRPFRTTVDGAPPAPLFSDDSRLPANFEFRSVSPDGRWVLGRFADVQARSLRTAIVSIDGALPMKTLPFTTDQVRWARDGQALEDTIVRGGVANIWRVPLDGSAPTQLTPFTSELIFRYGWSRDGKWLALARGTRSSDVVLITSEDDTSR